MHADGGRIFTQLWHMGRVVHTSMPGRGQPVSASATTVPGLDQSYDGEQAHTQARALRVDEISTLLEDYRNALAASFDGTQIHSAKGYLLDQSCATAPTCESTSTTVPPGTAHGCRGR